MHKKHLIHKIITSGILLLFPFPILAQIAPVDVPTPPPPFVLNIKQGAQITSATPLITGVTWNKTNVDIYIDDVLDGQAKVRDHPSGTASFAYKPFLPIQPGEIHTLYTTARSTEARVQSAKGAVINFEVVPFPAPTLTTPESHSKIIEPTPIVTGVAKNDSLVKIFVDENLDGQVEVENHPSSSAGFSYKVQTKLGVGEHIVKAVAVDPTARVSAPSNALVFNVEAPFVTPTVVKPALKSTVKAPRPLVVGLARNGSVVRFYIDGKLDGSLIGSEHPSGTFSFAYKPNKDLGVGAHSIAVAAVNQNGKPSLKSKPVQFFVTKVAKAPAPLAKALLKKEEKPAIGGPIPVPPKKEEPGKVDLDKIEKEGKIAATDEEKDGGPVVKEPVEKKVEEKAEEEKKTNLPLIIGLIVLGVLIISFIIWYIGQKRASVEEGIKKLFTEEEGPEGEEEVSIKPMSSEPPSEGQSVFPWESEDEDQFPPPPPPL